MLILTCMLQAIGSLQQLTFFDASKNNIESIAPEIENCVSLTDMHLSTNQLLYLPESIGISQAFLSYHQSVVIVYN